MKWRCKKCGNRWRAKLSDVRGQKTGCPRCSYELRGKNLQGTIEDCHQVGKRVGATCLSKKYSGALSKYLWRCNECGHQWRARYAGVQQGYGCVRCGLKRGAEIRQNSIRDAHLAAEKVNAKFIGERYTGTDVNMLAMQSMWAHVVCNLHQRQSGKSMPAMCAKDFTV